MQKTNNYKLNKPDYSDVVDVEMLNENADIIDAELAKKINKTDLPRENVYCGLTTGTATIYTAKANPKLGKYEDGMFVTIIPHIECANNPTLNIDGLGALILKNSSGDNIMAGDLKANIPCTFVRVGSSFFMRSSALDLSKLFGEHPWIYTGLKIPTSRSWGLSACSNNKKIYILGGVGANADIGDVEYMDILDTVSGIWSKSAHIPASISQLSSMCIYNGEIFFIGGNLHGIPVNTVQIYNIASNTWRMGANMPSARERLAICAHNGKIYAIGSVAWNVVEIYDIATDTWVNSGNCPQETAHSRTAHVYNNKIYILSKTSMMIFDTVTQNWSIGASRATPSVDLTTVLYKDKIFCLGGCDLESGSKMYDSVNIYNITNNTWSISTPMMMNRLGSTATEVDGKIYCIGGLVSTDKIDLATNTNKIDICIADWKSVK